MKIFHKVSGPVPELGLLPDPAKGLAPVVGWWFDKAQMPQEAYNCYFTNGDLVPEWIQTWIEVCQRCLSHGRVSIWRRVSTNKFDYQPFTWADFFYRFHHDSNGASGLLVNVDSCDTPQNCRAAVASLEGGLALLGELPLVDDLITRKSWSESVVKS